MSEEKRSTDDDHDAVAKNIDDLDSVARKASEDRIPTPENTSESKAVSDAETKPVTTPAVASEEEDEDEEDEDEDAANPAAIARRVAALGADDATEALAREEERKLAERRATKKKGKKGGLEAAASKKLSKIGTRAEPAKRIIAVASDADPLIERTAKLSDWAKKNQTIVQMVGGLATVALLGVAGFLYYQHKHEAEASVVLTKAVDVQQAKIGEPKKDDDEEDAPKETYFKTYDDRRAAALKDYQEVESKFPGTGAAILARLAEGSLQLDTKNPDKALAAFNDVKGSALAAADTEVKGRALEGVGFANEMKAVVTPAEKDKDLDAALAAFKDMENSADVKGFKEMAMYHQARVLMAKGDKPKAKEILLSLKERLEKPEDPIASGLPASPTYPYLKDVAMDRLREIDPAAAPKMKAPAMGGPHGGGNGGGQMSQEQIKKLMEQFQKGQK